MALRDPSDHGLAGRQMDRQQITRVGGLMAEAVQSSRQYDTYLAVKFRESEVIAK